MPTIAEVRQQYPQYSDMSDADLAGALHAKFYSDIPRAEFDKKVGIAPAESYQPSLSDAVTDIPREIGAAFTQNYDTFKKGMTDRGSKGVVEGLLDTGKAVAAIPGMIASPFTGAARSLIGHPMAQATHEVGKIIAPEIAAKDNPQQMYENAKGDVDTAMSALAARKSIVPTAQVAPLSPGQEVAAAADRLSASGSPVQVPQAVATDSMAAQRIASGVKNIPLAGDPLVNAAERTLKQLGTKADEVSAGYGGGTVQGSGDAAKGAITDWIKGDSAKKSGALYDKVDTLVNPSVTTKLANTKNTVAEIQAERKAAYLPDGAAVDKVLKAVESDGLTYQGVKALRTSIGESMNSGILPEGMSGGDLKRIYSGLTDDLRSAALRAGGNDAVQAFDRANTYYKAVSARRESLAKIVGADGNTPAEKVFDKLSAMAGSNSRADIEKLAQARRTIGPQDWNEFASGVVAKLGRDVEGNFSPQRFLNDYNKISDAGKSVLFKSGGKSDLASHLDDIAKVSSRFKELQKFSNPSGTAQNVSFAALGASVMTAPLTTIGSVIGGRALSMALARPATAASIAKVSRAQFALAASPSAANVASYSTAARNLINTLGEHAKGITPNDFLRSLQSPSYAPADNQPDVPRPPGQ